MTDQAAQADRGRPHPKLKNPAFVRRLKSGGLVPDGLIEELLSELDDNALDLLTTLVQSGYGAKQQLCQIWGDTIGKACVDLRKTLFQPEAVRKLPESHARKHCAIPIYQMGDAVTVAAAAPQSENLQNELERIMGGPVNLVFALPQDIEWAIDTNYHVPGALADFLEKISASRALAADQPITRRLLDKTAGSEALGQLHVAMILYAIKEGACELHLEPQGDRAAARLTGSGRRSRFDLERPVYEAVSKNLKKLARLEEEPAKEARSGRILFPTPGKKYDLRYFSRPDPNGEQISLTLKAAAPLERMPRLAELYLSKPLQDFIAACLEAGKGLFLLAGPEPGAQTPLAYAMIRESGVQPGRCLTIEEEVQYLIPGVQQHQVNPQAGYPVRALLEAALRQSPRLLFVESIDDAETAELLGQPEFTETLVIAGIQAENTFDALCRLRRQGLLEAAAAVLAHQPAARLCEQCRQAGPFPDALLLQLGGPPSGRRVSAWQGKGCPYCRGTGFSGRIGVFEFLPVTPVIRQLVEQGAGSRELHQAARTQTYENLDYDGLKKVLRGLVPLDELERISARLPEQQGAQTQF
jgi:type IV pilus assembly protein PilB